jgi:hypothetical protein
LLVGQRAARIHHVKPLDPSVHERSIYLRLYLYLVFIPEVADLEQK